jgi:DNA-binding CsgD family transcriptional regulator
MEVSAGRSNPEVAAALFISRKTVEMHLTRIYRKLGISNRAELVRFRRFAERGQRRG